MKPEFPLQAPIVILLIALAFGVFAGFVHWWIIMNLPAPESCVEVREHVTVCDDVAVARWGRA